MYHNIVSAMSVTTSKNAKAINTMPMTSAASDFIITVQMAEEVGIEPTEDFSPRFSGPVSQPIANSSLLTKSFD